MNTDLIKARNLLESQLKEAVGHNLADSIAVKQLADPADMTQEAGERDVSVQIIDRKSALVRRLQSAIERIDHECYGVCLECDEEIAPARLKALPWAELCIRCQGKAEESQHSRERTRAAQSWIEAA